MARIASVAVLGLAAACGSSGTAAPAAPSAAPVTVAAASEHAGHSAGAGVPAGGHAGHGAAGELELYAVQTGTLGVVVTDGEGRVLYGSGGDQPAPPRSNCTDTCAQTWLPLTLATGQQPELLGVDAAEVGTLARPDGSTQLTLGGWPVYVNKDDDGQLKAAAAGAAGSWFAMSPTGQKVPLPS